MNLVFISYSHITSDFEVPRSAQDCCRVDLAHVPRLIAGLDALDVQVPLFPLRLRHGEARIARNHQLVHRQNRLGVHADPGYLKIDFLSSRCTIGIVTFPSLSIICRNCEISLFVYLVFFGIGVFNVAHKVPITPRDSRRVGDRPRKPR